MALDLGTPQWKLVGIVDGRALFTHWGNQRSRWVDVRSWPGTLETAREEWTCAVCPGAMLVGAKRQTLYVDHRTPIALPEAHGYRAIGRVGARVLVVPGTLSIGGSASAAAPQVFDGTWRTLAGEGGADPANAAVVPLADGRALVVWGGRVWLFDGELHATDAGDLPPASEPGYVATGDGFITVGGGKLVTVTRAGKQREDRRIGRLDLVRVQAYDDALLLFDGRHYHRYDDGACARLDLGTELADPETLFAAPCGLVALVDNQRRLMRVR